MLYLGCLWWVRECSYLSNLLSKDRSLIYEGKLTYLPLIYHPVTREALICFRLLIIICFLLVQPRASLSASLRSKLPLLWFCWCPWCSVRPCFGSFLLSIILIFPGYSHLMWINAPFPKVMLRGLRDSSHLLQCDVIDTYIYVIYISI